MAQGSVTVYHPTVEDLRQRAEEGCYGGGRGKMDTREWYELCYFEPLEAFLYESLRTEYPEMAVTDIIVCISTWIYDNSVSRATRGAITDRLLCQFGSIPEREWPRAVVENKEKVVAEYSRNICDTIEQAEELLKAVEQKMGKHRIRGLELLPTQEAHEQAVAQAYKRGYITTYNFDMHNGEASAGPFLGLREDIDDYLDELVFKECAASDAAMTATADGVKALEEVNRIHRQKHIEFAEYGAKFLYKQVTDEQTGQKVNTPLTEQEQQEYIKSVERSFDQCPEE